MSTNYDSTNVGVPYVRCNRVTLIWPENGLATVSVEQETAVKLADGTIAALSPMPSITYTVDLANEGDASIPLVDPTSGVDLGVTTTPNQIFLDIVAAIRSQQLLVNP